MAKCKEDCLHCQLPKCKHDKYQSEQKKTYKKNDPEYFNKWYQGHKDSVLTRVNSRYEEKHDEILEYQRRYREAHREEWRKGGKYDYSNRRKRKEAAHTILQEQASSM